MKYAKLAIDASCHNSSEPAPMRVGYIIEEGGREIVRVGEYVGEGTINRAEYLALIHGLRYAARLGIDGLSVYTDSQLLAYHVMGRYRVKDAALRRLYNEVLELQRLFPGGVSICWTRREGNERADALTRKTEHWIAEGVEQLSDDELLMRWYGKGESLRSSVVLAVLGLSGEEGKTWLGEAKRRLRLSYPD